MGDRLATIDMGRKLGGGLWPPFWGELGPHLTQCGRDEAYLRAKFHLDQSTVWPQYTNVTDRTGQTTVRQHRANRFTNGRPKMGDSGRPHCPQDASVCHTG